MIDNVGQDEWFNLYLYLGSCWVNKSRYEARYSIRYRTQSPDLNQKESWSIDRAETENQSWTQGVSTRKSSWNQFQDHLLKKDQFVDDLFIIYRINQDQDLSKPLKEEPSCVRVRWDGPTRIFQTNFSSRIR